MIKTIKVSDKGQISIPRDFRECLGIETGDELILIEDNGRLLIERSDKITKIVKDDFADIVALTEKSLVDIWDNEEDDIWNEYLKKKE